MSSPSKKRPHISIAVTNAKLGAGEFATILNGDDARQILSALKSFTTTVKRERKEALQIKDDDDEYGYGDDGDGSDGEEEGADNAEPSSKKKLKEDWMKDSKDYNVPFVGTSVAKGDTGHVVVGEWPTGFLEAYLKQSPLAVELTSTDLIPPYGHVHKKLLRQKQGKLSYAIYRAYLAVVSELLTAAIPMAALKREYGVETDDDENGNTVLNEHPKFMMTVIKDRFPDLVQLLNEETGSGKGKTGSISGIGQLAAPVLQIVTRLAATSLGASRQVARSLDAILSEGALKILLREPRKPKEKANGDVEGQQDKDQQMSDRLAVPYKTRSACLQLAAVLLGIHDASVTSYISTFGKKERKNNPGILYLSVRYGLQDSMFQEEEDQDEITEAQGEYLESVSDLLQSIAVLLGEEKEGALLPRRALADLLGAEALQNVSQAATCAPALHSFQAVLKGEDDHNSAVTPTEDVGIDARRLLFPLLSSLSKSPFLWRITGKDDDKLSTLYTTFVVKSLNQILNTSASIPTQNFIIHALVENTLLLPGFFKGVQIPDVNKATFRFLAKLRFIGRVMKEGPAPSLCISTIATALDPRGVEKMLLSLLPQNFNKHVLSRAIQSSNPLAVAEATKFVILALARFQSLLPALHESSDENRDLVSHAFFSRLPDVQALVSTRSKFDPFVNHEKKANVIINGLICRLLNAFVEVMPSAIVSSKFDWTKLLPDDPANFTKAKPIAQVQILQTLEAIMKCKADNSIEQHDAVKPTAKACRALVEVAINASHMTAYSRARSIAKEMLLRLIECPGETSEASNCLDYEISLWIDGLEQELLPDFQRLLDEAVKNTFRHKLNRIQSWRKADLQSAVPDFSFSLLLSIGLARLNDDGPSSKFVKLICQIASRCLLFHSNPVPLAAVVHAAFENSHTGDMQLKVYAALVLGICKDEFDCTRSLTVFRSGTKLLESLLGTFLKDESLGASACSNMDVTTRERTLYLRYCLQSIAVIDGFPEHKELHTICVGNVHRTIRCLMQSGEIEPILKVMSHPAVSRGFLPRRTIGFLELLALVCSKSGSGVDFDHLTASLTARLDDSTEVANLQLYDVLKIWFCNHFVQIPRYGDIGNGLVRLATESSTQRAPESRNVERALTLNWISQRHISFSTETAWTAWESETSTVVTKSQRDYAIVQAMENALCSVEHTEECLLFVKMRELGSHECFGRCLLSLLLEKKVDATRKPTSSLLAKAIKIGCQDIEGILLFLTAGMKTETSTVQSFLKQYSVSLSDFFDLWTSGFLDSALVASTKCRDDELMRKSLAITVIETKTRDSASLLLGTISERPAMEFKGVSFGHTDELTKGLVEFSDSVDQLDEQHVAILAILFDSLPKALKNSFRVEEDDASVSFCISLLNRALQVVDNLDANGSDLSSVSIDPVVKSCLKFGISGSQGKVALQKASCLKLVRLLLCLRHQHETIPDWGESSDFLNPGTIWFMALSHSSFTDAIIPSEGQDGNQWRVAREELIKLLVCCCSIATEKLSIDQGVLNTLLVAYNGGTTSTDISLRRLFHLIAPSISEEQMAFADDLCSRALSSGNETKEEGWHFLGDVLDLRRVRETLSQFPRCQYLSPTPLDFEMWVQAGSANDKDMSEETEENESDVESIDESDSSVDSESGESKDKLSGTHVSSPPVDDTWKGRGPDHRYDPSFIVPQIVAALENLLAAEADEQANEHSEAFARFAQQICEKGGLSLCLASLCSSCSSLRRYAFAGLCLLLQAVDSEAAKDSKTWRDRPQLKMILNAVQRGFVMRKAMLASKGLAALIPKVSPLSAIFLAKASQILSKPGDVMFGAINRYFLKVEKSHGAYDDMTRLPAFIPLFCSSAEEHAERERHWALQCLRDSFLEGYSIVASCHAPQLLLTTLGRTHLDESERQLIIQVLTRLLQFGERAATHDLLGRVGLLSWLRAFLVSGPVEDTGPVISLVEVAIQQGMKYTEKGNQEQLILDLRNLLATMAKINGGERVFCLIVDSLFELGYRKSVSPAGVQLETGLQLIASSDSKKNKVRMLEAVCKAPVVIDGSSVPDYCTAILHHLLELPDVNVSLVLQRICDLAQYPSYMYAVASTPWSTDLLRLVLTAHSQAVRTDAYRLCIEALVNKLQNDGIDDDNEWISLAKRALHFLQEDAKQPKK